MYNNEFEPYLNIIDFLMEEIKNVRREKCDLIARLNMLEHDNIILKGRLEAKNVEEKN